MKTSLLCLSFVLSLTSLTLTSEEEELRQINLGQVGPTLLQFLTAGAAGAGVAAVAAALSGGKGKDGGLFGKHGLFGGKHGKGRKRSLLTDEERLDISGLLSSLGGNTGSPSTSEVTGGKGKDGKGGKGKEGKGKDGKGKGGKGKEGKDGKGKDGKGGKGKGKESAPESSIPDTPSTNPLDSLLSLLIDSLSNFGLLGQIIQTALSLLTGVASSLNPFSRTLMDEKASLSPLPNPLTDPLGFIMNPLITAFLDAILAGDISALMKALGDLAGTLITQFITNTIAG